MFFRLCPRCNNQVFHNIKSNRDQAQKKGRLCNPCSHAVRDVSGDKNPFYGKTHTSAAKAKIAAGDKSFCNKKSYRDKRSKAVMGENNPNYGISNYQRWVEKYGKEKADELDLKYRAKQSELNSGPNNSMYGKPAPQGSGNGWSGWYKDNFFRSLLELSYIVTELEGKNKKWKTAESKDLSIAYTSWDGKQRTYRADFLVEEKFLVEVKPLKLQSSISVRAKQQAAENFCKHRGLEYKIEDIPRLSTDEVVDLVERGLVVFTKKYQAAFQEWCKNGKR